MRSMCLLSGLVFLLNLSTFAAAQPPQPAPTTTIYARSNLVVVDVTVLDAQQNPVHNLTANDFKIFEDGHLQTVRDFEVHSVGTEPRRIAPLPMLEPGTYTNRTPVPASGPLNVLLIDYLNTSISDRPYLRNHVLKFLKQMRPGTQVAIFAVGDHLHLVQGFTSDVVRLRAVVVGEEPTALAPPSPADNSEAMDGKLQSGSTEAAIQTAAPKPLNGRSESPALAQVAIEALRVPTIPPIQRQILTVQAISELARYLATLPDRKNLIWYSASFPAPKFISNVLSVDPALITSTENTGSQLGANRVAVFPIDDAGLTTDESLDAENAGPHDSNNDKDSIKAGAPGKPGDVSKTDQSVIGPDIFWFVHLNEHIQGMRDLAEKTGGKAFFNTNDLARATEQAVEAGSNYYTLTYVPSKAPVGILPERSIKVEVARKDVTLFYRNKYPVDNPHTQNQASHSPSPAAPKNSPSDAAPALSDAMRVAMIHGAPEPTGIVFLATARPTGADPEPTHGSKASKNVKVPHRRYAVRIVANASDIDCPAAADGVRHCALQIVTDIYDSGGALFGNLIIPAKFNIPADHYDALLRDGIELKQQVGVPLSMQDCTLRLGILDMNSGRVGAVEFPLANAAQLMPVSVSRP